MRSGEFITVGSSIFSENQLFKVDLTSTGLSLVRCIQSKTPLWTWSVPNGNGPLWRMWMRYDGVLVCAGFKSEERFCPMPPRPFERGGDAELVMQNDGNLVLSAGTWQYPTKTVVSSARTNGEERICWLRSRSRASS
jgi:hypothetical protein